MNNPNEKELLALIKERATNQEKTQAKISNSQERGDQLNAPCFRVVGGGSKDFYGAPLKGEPLSTKGLQGIVSYEPSELYITAQAGTPLIEVESVLKEKGQYLAFDAPNFTGSATIGGVVAAGLSGPARASSGSVRDYVLGLTMINGRGEHLSFGGQVIKNVAGYDVSRVLCGSWGTLGVITQVSLKVLPQSTAEQTILLHGIDQQRAIEWLNQWGATALPLNASVWRGVSGDKFVPSKTNTTKGELLIRLRGAAAAVAAGFQNVQNQCTAHGVTLQTLEEQAAEQTWVDYKNQSQEFFKNPICTEDCLWRLSVPQKTPVLNIEGVDPSKPQCMEWNAGLRWIWAPSASSQTIQSKAKSVGGHATLWRVSQSLSALDKDVGVFTEISSAQRRIQNSLQREFDPWGLFDTGRLEI
jgi:glycolate oxidase FAD binding subunit